MSNTIAHILRPVMALLLTIVVAFAHTPYEGKVFVYYQPDGSSFQIRLYGDAHYAVAETLDGYVIARDPASGFWCYAVLNDGKTSFESTGIRVPSAADVKNAEEIILEAAALAPADLPDGVVPHLRMNREAVHDLRKAHEQMMGEDGRGRLLDPDAPLMAEGGEIQPGPPSSQTLGSRNTLTLLVSFPDAQADVTIPQSDVDDYFNQKGFNKWGNRGSVGEYWSVQSAGKFTLTSTVTAYYTALNNKSYYTDESISHGTRAKELINEAIAALHNDGFDFASCNANGDSRIDGVNCLYAGSVTNAWSKGLWPHKWSSGNSVIVEGTITSSAYTYQISSLPSSGISLTTVCHETGHMVCGFPDLYVYSDQTTYTNGYRGLGNYGLMASSSNANNVSAYLKYHAGWLNVIEITAASHENAAVTVDGANAYMFRNPADADEYFLIETRQKNVGWETTTPSDEGLIIYHCDENGDNTGRSKTNDMECVVVQADTADYAGYEKGTGRGAGDLFHAGTDDSFSSSTAPIAQWKDGSNAGIVIHSISAVQNPMTFVVGTGAVTGNQVISISTSTFAPTCSYHTVAEADSFSVWNSGAGTLNYTVSDNVSWLSVAPTSGSITTGSDVITVTYATGSLATGTYNATITISDSGAVAADKTIAVTLTVFAQPTIGLSPSSLTENMGTAETSQKSVGITNTGGGTMSYTLSESATWLSLSHTTGNVALETDTLYLNFDSTGLTNGVYVENIQIAGTNATNTPQTITVTLNITGSDLVVTTPNASGLTWARSGTHDITWTSAGTVTGNVKIELLKGGALDSVIVASTANDGTYSWAIPGGQTVATDYTVRITSINEPSLFDVSNANFEIKAPVSTSLPYSESFNTDLGIWVQSTSDHIDWVRHTSGTPSSGTGPSGAQEGTHYLYIEDTDDGGSGTDEAVIEAEFNLSAVSLAELSFYYHMYGSTTNALHVDISSNGGQSWNNSVWSKSGQQHTSNSNAWTKASIDLTSYKNISTKIRIRAIASTSYQGDIAIDNITLIEPPPIVVYSPLTFTEQVNNDGSITNAITVTLGYETFAGTASEDLVGSSKVSFGSVPTGLTGTAVLDSATQVTLGLTGTANAHTDAEDMSTLSVVFANSAFTGGNAAGVTDSTKLLSVEFGEPEAAVTRGGKAVLDGGTDSLAGVKVGNGQSLTYTISNEAAATLDLTISNASISNESNCGVVINTQPTSPVAASNSTTVAVTVTPTAAGVFSFDISIPNTDADENPYNWTASGMSSIYDHLVDTLVDEDDGDYSASDYSLREAIDQSLAGQTIGFNVTGIISLNGTVLPLTKNLTINGGSNITINGGATSGIFDMSTGDPTVTIEGVTLTNGSALRGGGINVDDGTLTLESCVINTCVATGTGGTDGGGAIFVSNGTVSLTNSTISSCTAVEEGGALRFFDTGCSLTIDNSTLSNNISGEGSANCKLGGAIYLRYGTLIIRNGTVFSNNASKSNSGQTYAGSGGAVYTSNDAVVTVSDTTFYGNTCRLNGAAIFLNTGTGSFTNCDFGTVANGGNTATTNGGAVYVSSANCTIESCNFRGNNAVDGGALYTSLQTSRGKTLTIKSSLFDDNTASSEGGAFYNAGSASVHNSTFSNNIVANGSSGGGGAISNGGNTRYVLLLESCTFSGNKADETGSAGDGGAIDNNGGLTMVNCTVSGNLSGDQGGGMYINGATTAWLKMTNSTIVNNNAVTDPAGGGVCINTALHTELRNCVIANNTANSADNDLSGNGSVMDYCVYESRSGTWGTDTNNSVADPNLGSLSNNGGSTLTHAIQSPSTAIDGGSSAEELRYAYPNRFAMVHSAAGVTGITSSNTDSEGKLYISFATANGIDWQADMYKDEARTQKVGHSATTFTLENGVVNKAVTADGGSGLAGTLSVNTTPSIMSFYETGEGDAQIDAYDLTGVTLSNTDAGKLYGEIVVLSGSSSADNVVEARFYSDAAETTLVARSASWVLADEGAVKTISAEGGSGIGGTITVSTGDSDAPRADTTFWAMDFAPLGESSYIMTEVAYDQRGTGFDRIKNGGTSLTVDIGAYEYQGVLVPEIEVSRSGSIADGGTDSIGLISTGSGTQLTYSIGNSGTADLTLSNAVVTPVSNCTVSIDTNVTSPVSASNNTPLIVTVTPTADGVWSFTISIVNNDVDETPYNWSVSGTAASSSFSVSFSAAGLYMFGYAGTDADAETEVFAGLIADGALEYVRTIDSTTGITKDLYYDVAAQSWVNDIGTMSAGSGYIVKVVKSATLTIAGSRSSGEGAHSLSAGYSLIGYRGTVETANATDAFSDIKVHNNNIVRWVDGGITKELYHNGTSWVDNIGTLRKDEAYIIKLENATTVTIQP